jgi:hypothetical protein
MEANSLVGSTVNIAVNSTQTTSGQVTGVTMVDGAPEIIVGGSDYELSQVTGISPTATSNVAASSNSGTSANNTSNTTQTSQ